MPHFTPPSAPSPPTSAGYLFLADMTISIIPPQDYTAVPTIDGQVYIHWDKHANTLDTSNDLYAEIYRSTDLETYTLLTTLQWLNYDYYNDTDVLVGNIYYYKLRFVRIDANNVITNTSDYTYVESVKVTNSLGFEPSDTYSNKFFNFLIQDLPGTRVYDHTSAAHFSASTHDWQTTCKITDGFKLFINSALVATEAADATALYAKRPVSFFVDKKQVVVQGQNTSDGVYGEYVHLNSYLVYSFLMSYATQFMFLYEKYLQIVANKYVYGSQVYTKGFKPVVSDRKDISIAELYYSFGQLLGLIPFQSKTEDQGLNRYKSLLVNSFSNQDNVGRIEGIKQAGTNVFGTTDHLVQEYKDYHWLKSDRESKVYFAPELSTLSYSYTTAMALGADSDITYTSKNNNYTLLVQYTDSNVYLTNGDPAPTLGVHDTVDVTTEPTGITLNSTTSTSILDLASYVGKSGDITVDITTYNAIAVTIAHRTNVIHVTTDGNITIDDPIWLTGSSDNSDITLVGTDITADFTKAGAADSCHFMILSGSELSTPDNCWLETVTSDTDYYVLMIVHYEFGVTTASEIKDLIDNDVSMSTLFDVTLEGTGSGVIGDFGPPVVSDNFGPELLKPADRYIAWEKHSNNLYNKKNVIDDTTTTETITDTCAYMAMLSKTDGNSNIQATTRPNFDPNLIEADQLNKLDDNTLLLVRDDNDEYVSYYQTETAIGIDISDTVPPVITKNLKGDKRILLRFNHTPDNMAFLTKAYLKIFIHQSTSSGYLRLYRVRKNYSDTNVCYNYRDKQSVTGYNYINQTYTNNTTSWITKDWKADGLKDESDAVFIKQFYLPKIENPGWVSFDVTDILQQIYKYENSNLNLDSTESYESNLYNEENILGTGFLLTMEGFPNKNIVVIRGAYDATYAPRIEIERLTHGFYRYTSNPTISKFIYTDGTKRFNRLFVQITNDEPLPYIRTVYERILAKDVKYVNNIFVTLDAVSGLAVGDYIYGQTSGALGKVMSIDTDTFLIEVYEYNRHFEVETINVAPINEDDGEISFDIQRITYTGNVFVQLSRNPITNSELKVYYNLLQATESTYPDSYPVYSATASDDIYPIFESSSSGDEYPSVEFDTTDRTKVLINMTTYVDTETATNTTEDLLVMYQYEYKYEMLGKVTFDSTSITKIEGSSRMGYGAIGISENDYNYKTNVLLPKLDNTTNPPVDTTDYADEYSTNNKNILTKAVSNVNRFNSKADIFSYGYLGRSYQFGTQYHTFFKRA